MRLLRAMAGSSPQWPGDELAGVIGFVTHRFELPSSCFLMGWIHPIESSKNLEST